MDDKEYQQELENNPLLNWQPEFMTSPDCRSRDFVYTEREQILDTPAVDVYESRNSLNN